MFLYWRVLNDLNCMGETIIFHDPSFIRCFTRWIRKHTVALAMAEDFAAEDFLKNSMN